MHNNLWNISNNDIIIYTKKLIVQSIKNINHFLSIDVNVNNFKVVIHSIIKLFEQIESFHSMCKFLFFVSNNDFKKTYKKANIMITNLITELNYNKHFYNKICELQKLSSNDAFIYENNFLQKIINKYIDNGAELNENNRTLFLEIKTNIYKIEKELLLKNQCMENKIFYFDET